MKKLCGLLLLSSLIILAAFKQTGKDTENYPIRPVPFTSVKMNDNFWAPRIQKDHDVTIPIAFGYCESTGRVKNFDIAAGRDTGKFQTLYPFDDSDVYKIIEGAAYSLQTYPDPKLEAYIDTLADKIAAAQEPDGYLYTNRTIAEKRGEKPHEWAGDKRWLMDNQLSHELYNLGHLYEAAVAYYQATGKRKLLDVAIKSADLVDKDMGWGKLVQYPGHQVIEMGLVKLYRVTGEKRYLNLAKFFLDARGTRPDGEEYSQSHKKVIDQTEAVGHAVRATYMYSGMADIASILKDQAYVNAITKIWEDIVFRKLYITGGIGASGGNEGFGDPYYLPNMSAYCETCASIGNIFFNHRMFSLHGDGKYYDVLERTLYNGALSGVNLAGDRFFYPNPLESSGQHQRSPWFGCACCPSNVARFIPAIPGYVYSVTDNDLYVNLFASSNANVEFGKNKVNLTQQTNYPWDGSVKMKIDPERAGKFALHVRIPGWARNEAIPGDLYKFTNKSDEKYVLKVNGKEETFSVENGYAIINRKWKKGDVVDLYLPMPVRTVIADSRVDADKDKYAVQRGPLMYCAEWPDNKEGKILNLIIDEKPEFKAVFKPELLNGAEVITTKARQVKKNVDGSVSTGNYEDITLIPYHLWNNRGAGEMRVWLPYRESETNALPAPTIAFNSKVSASKDLKTLSYVKDQYEPKNSSDQSWPYFHWWPNKGTWEWIQYDFEKPVTVSKVKVYWFDDEPFGECRIPEEFVVMYKDGEEWKEVKPTSPVTVSKDQWNIVTFDPVSTSAMKIKLKMKKDFSAGIHEWVVE